MKSFLIANPKGGSGKSTLATNLASNRRASGCVCGRRFLPAIRNWEIEREDGRTSPRGHRAEPATSCSTRRPACTARRSTAC